MGAETIKQKSVEEVENVVQTKEPEFLVVDPIEEASNLRGMGLKVDLDYSVRDVFSAERKKNEAKKEKKVSRENDSKKNEIKKETGEVEEKVDERSKEKQTGFEKEKAVEWAERFIPFEVLDAYALSYVKNKKTPEKKRLNKKYSKYLEKAKKELLPKLTDFLVVEIKQNSIAKDERDDKKIKNKIAEILKSDMHAKALLRVMNMDWKDLKASKNDDKKVSKAEKSKEKSKVKTETKIKTEKKKEVVLKQEKSKKIEVKISKEEKEFFEKFRKDVFYTNFLNGTEFQILKYNPKNKKVTVFIYQASFYDKENKAHEFISDKERFEEREIEYTEFVDLFENSYINEVGEIKEKNQKQELKLNKSEEALLEIFSQKESKFLQEALLEYVEDYQEELDDYFGKEEAFEGEYYKKKEKDKYLKNFWSVILPQKLNEFQDIIALSKKSAVLDYLKMKTKTKLNINL